MSWKDAVGGFASIVITLPVGFVLLVAIEWVERKTGRWKPYWGDGFLGKRKRIP